MQDRKALAEAIREFLKAEEEVYAPISSFDVEGSGTVQVKSDADSRPQAKPKAEQQATSVATAENGDSSQGATSSQKIETEEQNTERMSDKLKACTTLDELRELCEQAEELKTDLENTRLVFGTGNPQADLMLIGEAPGAQEDKEGEPFVGASGKLLTKILAAIKVDRKDVFIANILKHRPPDNRDPKPEERSRSLPFLERQIDIINPKLILCLGRVPAQTLLESKETLGSLRGSFHPYREKYELMVTYHPAALLRDPRRKRDTWEDVQKLRERYDELGAKPALAPII